MTQAPAPVAMGPEMGAPVPEVPWMMRIEEHPAWPVLSQLPVTMAAGIRLSRFRVRDLLGLAEGQVFESASPDTEDVPLKVGDVQLGWTEFEVIEQKIALRLTRLV
jgi:flagellar motor switch protein FliN/FliY